MAKGGAARGGGARRPSSGARGSGGRPARKPDRARPAHRPAPSAAVDDGSGTEPREFRLGTIPGATPGKWVQIWRERMPEVPLQLVPIPAGQERAPLLGGDLDAALVRLPLDGEGLHVISLYEEVPVVVMSADSALTVVETLDRGDLAGETLIVPADDVLAVAIPGTEPPRFAQPRDTEQAIAIVASGVGVAVVPMSLARLFGRNDVEHRPLRDGPTSTVALAWPADRTTADVETFIGIVRGRTANSSR